MISLPAALLIVEMQNDLCAPSLCDKDGLSGALARAVQRRGILEKLPRVLDACRARDITVLYATKERHPGLPQPEFPPIYATAGQEPKLVRGTWGAQVVDALKPEPGDIVLPRFTSLDPSLGGALFETLERLGARTLVVAGISTTIAVEGTVRAAANRGLHVVVLEDLCASVPDEWHRFTVENVLPLLAQVTSGDAFVEMLG